MIEYTVRVYKSQPVREITMEELTKLLLDFHLNPIAAIQS